jgi:hypothetical protein
MSRGWHVLHDQGSVTLCRHMPPRFVVSVSAHLSAGRPVRLAHQIRQDMWRALQRVRGFSPVVRLEPTDQGWHVTAGGRVAGRVSPATERAIAAVLNDPTKRTRWVQTASAAQ